MTTNTWAHYRTRGSLTAPQVAEILGISAQTVLRMADSGTLPVIELTRTGAERRTRRFPTAAILSLVDQPMPSSSDSRSQGHDEHDPEIPVTAHVSRRSVS
jgi:excisionase family DNA binding protein